MTDVIETNIGVYSKSKKRICEYCAEPFIHIDNTNETIDYHFCHVVNQGFRYSVEKITKNTGFKIGRGNFPEDSETE